MRIVTSRRREAGMTLIELMVGLLIGMLLTLAIFEVMATFEGRKRTLTSVNDIEHAGQLALYKIDSWLRSAGAGLPQSAAYAYGCPVYASKSSVPILPLTTTLDPPFASVNPGTSGVFRAAPVLILPDQTTPGASGKTSDVLVMMAASGDSGTPVPFSESSVATSSSLDLQNTVDFSANDLVLVADQQSLPGGARKPCMVGQVGSTFTGASSPLPLSGDYQAATISSASLTSYSSAAVAMKLGNVASGRTPLFMLLGVGDDNVLYSYDLLRTNDNTLQAQAEGVFEMHAVYGVDTNNDGKIDSWVSPSTGNYALSVLSAGDQIAATRLAQIKAIRVGLILRTSLAEREVAPNLPLTLFADLDKLVYTRSLSDQEQHFRYRTMETTIPVRNNSF